MEDEQKMIQEGEICPICKTPHIQKVGFETVCMACGQHARPDKSTAMTRGVRTIRNPKHPDYKAIP